MNTENHNTDWDLIIESKSSIFSLNLKDVWRYRDLLQMFVKRDFISTFKQTILGPLWFFIQPIFTTITFVFIFGNLAGISTDGLPKVLFYLTGITAWNYFATCLTATSTVFNSNASVFGKVYFPRLISPLSIVISNLLKFGVQLSLLVVMMVYYYFKGANFHITWAILIFPFLVIMMAMLSLGLGMLISSLTTKYRDLAFLVTFGVQLLMYATTVIYPLSAAPEKFRTIIELNPMTGIIEAFRYSLLGKGEFSLHTLGFSAIFTVIVLILGIVVFNKTEKTFIDTV
jgi:lipopolysaccharide transport system permease protein